MHVYDLPLPKPTMPHVQGCRVTDNHPVFVDGKWQLPVGLGPVVQRFGTVFGVELEGWLLN